MWRPRKSMCSLDGWPSMDDATKKVIREVIKIVATMMAMVLLLAVLYWMRV